MNVKKGRICYKKNVKVWILQEYHESFELQIYKYEYMQIWRRVITFEEEIFFFDLNTMDSKNMQVLNA